MAKAKSKPKVSKKKSSVEEKVPKENIVLDVPNGDLSIIDHGKISKILNSDYLIWPKPIPVIGVTGEYSSGKTLFALTVDPTRTLIFDEEKSSATYDDLGIKKRIDLIDEVARNIGETFKAIEVFQYFYDYIKSIKPGEYSVIVIDTVGLIESGLCDWVEAHPEDFGRTRVQYQKAQAIFWGDVKEYWKIVLSEIASRCQSLIFTVHMGAEFKGGEATGKRKPKGKETLKELSTLFLQLERKMHPQTKEQPKVPLGIVLKSRLAKSKMKEDGEMGMIPLLPPRILKCTPQAIRNHINNPPNYETLSDDEKEKEETLSDDERLILETRRATANQLKAEADLQREGIKTKRLEQDHQLKAMKELEISSSDKITKEQIKRISELKEMLITSNGLHSDPEKAEALWKETLKPFHVKSAMNLPKRDADTLIAELEKSQDPFSASKDSGG